MVVPHYALVFLLSTTLLLTGQPAMAQDKQAAMKTMPDGVVRSGPSRDIPQTATESAPVTLQRSERELAGSAQAESRAYPLKRSTKRSVPPQATVLQPQQPSLVESPEDDHVEARGQSVGER